MKGWADGRKQAQNGSLDDILVDFAQSDLGCKVLKRDKKAKLWTGTIFTAKSHIDLVQFCII